jgi:hypothetical protein
MWKKATAAASFVLLTLFLIGSAAGQEVKQLVKDLKDSAKRMNTLGKIAELGPKAAEAAEPLVEIMMDKSPAARSKAATALEAVDPEIYRHVMTLFIGQDKDKALKDIADMGASGKAALPVVLKIALRPYPGDKEDYPDPRLQLRAIEAMRKLAPDDKRVAKAILTLASRPRKARNDSIRLEALRNLDEMDIDAKEKVPVLMPALNESSCVMLAIQALGRMEADAKAALPALKRLKFSPIDAVRDAATEAVRKIEKR